MEQLYEMWLKSQKPEKGEDSAAQANRENGKQIHMPTDYAEVTVRLGGPAVSFDSGLFLCAREVKAGVCLGPRNGWGWGHTRDR